MTDLPQTTGDSGERDATTGRFLRGNAASAGHSNRSRARIELRRALVDACGGDGLDAAATALVARAVSGDVTALRLLFEYVCGRPRVAQPEGALNLGDLRSADGAAAALRTITAAAADGTIDGEHAASLAGLVRVALDAGAVAQLEQRVAELERNLHQ